MTTEWLYAIRSERGGPTKIGRSTSPRERLMNLRTGSPLPLRILAIWPLKPATLEQDMHHYFRARRLHGEWFDLGNDPVTEINRAMAQMRGHVQRQRPRRLRELALVVVGLFLVVALGLYLGVCEGLGC